MYTCAVCGVHVCRTENKDKMPANCPIRETEVEETLKCYQEPENFKLAYNSSLVEAEGYCQKSRLEEIIDFAKKCGYKHLGIDFCIGSRNEAKILHKILTAHGFQVDSVVCKNGSIPKENLGITEEQKVRPGTYEPMCNPIGQAKFLNKAKTEFNILLNLCVGHDSLFFKYSEAPVTVFSAKDRVLAHNPIGALYLSESYYKGKLAPKE